MSESLICISTQSQENNNDSLPIHSDENEKDLSMHKSHESQLDENKKDLTTDENTI